MVKLMRKLPLILFFGLFLSVSFGQNFPSWKPVFRHGRSEEVMRDNELERNAIGQNTGIHCNPLLLDGQSLDYDTFTINSSGELTVIKGEYSDFDQTAPNYNPRSPEFIKIPFTVRLRRDGKILESEGMDFLNREGYKIEISKVLAFGKPGDQLIINPANKEDWKAKRILKLIE